MDVTYNPGYEDRMTDNLRPMTVRSNLSTSSGSSEFTGALCTVKNAIISASLTTPAIVNMPTYGQETRPANVYCTYDGMSISAVSEPYSVQKHQVRNASAQGGLVGVLIGEIIVAASDESNDDFVYEDVTVVFKKKEE